MIVRHRRTGQEVRYRGGVTFTEALRQAERYAAARGSHLVRRDAPWTRRDATPAQLAVLTRAGLTPPTGLSSGRASELISELAVSADFTRRPPRGYTTRVSA